MQSPVPASAGCGVRLPCSQPLRPHLWATQRLNEAFPPIAHAYLAINTRSLPVGSRRWPGSLHGLFSPPLIPFPLPLPRTPGLHTLRLQNNVLRVLPDVLLASLTSLTSVDASSNALEALPPSLGCLRRLAHLDVASNALQQLPASLGELASLTLLDASCNHLEFLPPSISGKEVSHDCALQGAGLWAVCGAPEGLNERCNAIGAWRGGASAAALLCPRARILTRLVALLKTCNNC